MKLLVEEMTKALVDHPEEVLVEEVAGEKTTVYELRVAKNDIGKVIGKRGATIHVRFHGMSVTIPGCLLDFPAAPCS